MFIGRVLKDVIDLTSNCEETSNQGSSPSCTGHAGRAMLGWLRNRVKKHLDHGWSWRCIYNLGQVIGGYLGSDGAMPTDILQGLIQYGACTLDRLPSSPEADVNLNPLVSIHPDDLKEGKIKDYRPLHSVEEIHETMDRTVVVYVTILWDRAWMTPRPDGTLAPATGDWVGGHALLAVAINTLKGLLRLQNSWGVMWSPLLNGHCWVLLDDVEDQFRDPNQPCEAYEPTDRYIPEPEPEPEPQPPPKPWYCSGLKALRNAINTLGMGSVRDILDQMLKDGGCQ
jgi:hypothetical protein